MANDNSSSSSTGIVAIVAILIMLAIGVVVAWRSGAFGGRNTDIDVNLKPAEPATSP
jgi:hypothetical protein